MTQCRRPTPTSTGMRAHETEPQVDLRTDALHHNALLRDRLDRLVPVLLREQGVDCWILIGREYAEDPVLRTMLPAEWLSARRTTILVLTPEDRWAVARYPVGDAFASAWDPESEPSQWGRLASLVSDLDPDTIAVGISSHQAHADGLTVSMYERLTAALPARFSERVVHGGDLGIRWLETRLPEERKHLEEATSFAHSILRRGLSREAIEPGETTTDDLVWWYRQTVHDAGLSSWFQPSVTIQRPDQEPAQTIRPGDLVHVDFGIVLRGLCTDQQEHAYVLREGETAVPEGLTRGLQAANRAQDLLIAEFEVGRTGNEILAAALAACAAEDLDATIYTHSIGVHGHGAGMTIGLWDQQDGVHGAGDHQLHPDTAYSIELMVESVVPEWHEGSYRFMLEQDAWFDGNRVSWLDGRQTDLHVI